MSIRAGLASSDITPPAGIYLTGFGLRTQPSTGVKLPLKAKSLVLEDGKEKVAIVTADLIGLGERTFKDVKRFVKERTGIENLVVLCSHTHSGPETSNLRGLGKIDENYIKTLVETLAKGVSLAARDMEEVRIGAGRGEARALSFNRNSRTFSPVDEELGILKIKGKKKLIHFINYTCHAVVLGPQNLLIHSDYPGEVQRYGEESLGGTVMFAQGCCGNIDPISYYYKWGIGDFHESERTGKIIVLETEKVSSEMKAFSEKNLKFKSKEVKLPLRWPTLGEAKKICEEAKDFANKYKGFGENAIMWSRKILEKVEKKDTPSYLISEIQVLSLCSAALVFLPGEVYVQIGMEIKKKSPFPYTFVCGYANNVLGYIASSDDFSMKWLQNKSPVWYWGSYFFDKSVGKVVVEESLNLLKYKEVLWKR